MTGILASCLVLSLSAAEPATFPLWGREVPGPALKDPANVPTVGSIILCISM